MFYSLTGKIVKKTLSGFAIECGGVAFWCQASELTLASLEQGKNATVFTHLNVREDALDLFAFESEAELEWFRLLTTVSGVGPKAALAILSLYVPDKLALCISAGDYRAITKASGVGPKLAQRVVNELKDKVGTVSGESAELSAVDSVSSSDSKSEAVAALTMLGYTQTDASVAVSKLDASLPVEDIIKLALKALTRL